MDRETILSLGEAYNQCYTLTEQQQAEVDLINERINALGPAASVGMGVWDYHDLRKQGYTHAEAIAKALLASGGGTLGAILGGGAGSAAGPVGTFAGGVGGGMAGYEGSNWLYDKLSGRVRGTVKDKDGNETTVAKVPGQTATLNGKKVVWGKNGGWEPAGDDKGTTKTETQPTVPGSLPSDYKGTEAQQFQAADKFRQGAGTSALPAEVQTQVKDAAAKQDAVDAQKDQGGGDKGGGGNLTPMQQWAKNFPKLAAKVKPGSAGYDEIQKMNQTQPRETQSQPNKITGVKSATKNMVQNTQKLNQGSQNMKTDIKTPGVRALSKTKDYSNTMNKANNNVKKAFATIPEQFEHELLEYMVEHDIDFVTGRDCYLDEGIGKLLQKLGRKALPAVKSGFKRVKEGGKWVLKKINKGKGAADDAADKVKSATKVKTKPSKAGLVDSKGNPLQVPVKTKAKTPTVKKPVVKTPTVKKPAVKKPGGGLVKKVATGATVAGVGGLAGNELYKALNKDKNNGGGSGGSGGGGGGAGSKPETKPTSDSGKPGSSGGSGKPGSSGGSGGSGGAKKPPSDRLATALKGTQDAITSERKAKEGKNYSGPSTIKNPGKYQSKIGTDFSDVKTEEAILRSMMDDLLGENRLTPAALEAAAAANQKRDKERGMKIHSTKGVKDLFNIKPGKV